MPLKYFMGDRDKGRQVLISENMVTLSVSSGFVVVYPITLLT